MKNNPAPRARLDAAKRSPRQTTGAEDAREDATLVIPVARPRPARTGSRPPGGPAVAGTAFTPDDIVDPWEREEFETLAVATQDGEGRKAGLVRDYLRCNQFGSENKSEPRRAMPSVSRVPR